MKRNQLFLVFKKAPFPAIMTVISFILFILANLLLATTIVEQFYLKGLLFAVPFVSFTIVAYYTSMEKLEMVGSIAITILLTVAFVFFSGFLLINLAISTATNVTTDINKYERVLKLTGYPSDPLTHFFPNKIPDDATEVQFSYHPAFLQGGEEFSLKYQADANCIKKYIEQVSPKAKWVGKPDSSEAEEQGLFQAKSLPNDFNIYLIYSKPYELNDWNHGKASLIAISEQRSEILFWAEDW